MFWKINKKAMSLSLVFLVLATLILTTSSLVIFHLRAKKITQEVHSVGFLNEMYAKEELIDYYVSGAMKSAVEGSKNPEFSQYDFEINFLAELSEYELIDTLMFLELEKIMQQIDEVHINYNEVEKTVTFRYEVTFENDLVITEDKKDRTLFDASYTYIKQIEKSAV